MSEIILKVNNISKCFHLDSLVEQSFKDELGAGMKSLFVKSTKWARGRNEFWALKDINFELKKGESLGIIGRNGAGKSTLLRIISRITEPTSGTVEITGSFASVLEIGTGLIPELSGKDNIISYCQLLGFSNKKINKLYPVIVEFSGISDFLEMPIKYYSTGMIMRLAFSVIIHLDEDLMLFDEIMAVGDLSFRAKCFERIANLKNQNKTFILVSHNLSDIANYCDRIIILESGIIMSIGTFTEVAGAYYKLNMKKDMVIKPEDIKTLESKILNLKKKFFESSENLTSKIEWTKTDTPGNENISFLKIALLNQKGEQTSVFQNDEIICIMTKFLRNISGTEADIIFLVSDIMDNRLFYDNIAAHSKSSEMNEKGLYDVFWKIPPYIFNQGIFKVSLFIFMNNLPVYRLVNVVSFEVTKDRKEQDEFRYYTPLLPDIKFMIEKANE
ncbi:MAG: ATP-binding cassette domain-containing protein [Bacteroidia bacterium]|nr:ATP-binding cassette domain-containing protein [Bacteroidia bacterium]